MDEMVEATQKEMFKWVRINYRKTGPNREYAQVEFPKKWKNSNDRTLFSSISEQILGEDEGTRWQQNCVFRYYGKDFGDTTVDVVISDFGKKFLHVFQFEIIKAIEDGTMICRGDKGISDDAMYDALESAFNPPKPNHMDNRLAFFAVHSNFLTYHRILEIQSIYADEKTARIYTDNLYIRICESLEKIGFYLEACQRHLCRDMNRCVENAKTGLLKVELIRGLTDILERSCPNEKDGLLSYFEQIINAKQTEVFNHFRYWHVNSIKSILEKRKKETPMGSGQTDTDDIRESPIAPAELSIEYTAGGVGKTDAKRHVEESEAIEQKARNDIWEAEHYHIIIKRFKKVIRKCLNKAEQTAGLIITELKNLQTKPIEDEDFSNDSDRLFVFYPEALRTYIRSIYDQIDILLRLENLRKDARGTMIFKKGRSEIKLIITKEGEIKVKNLSSMLSLKILNRNLKETIDKKFGVIELNAKGVEQGEIAKTIGESNEFVNDTLRLIQIIKSSKDRKQVRPKTHCKRKRLNNDPILWLNDLTASRLRNSLSCEWGIILAILYKPLKPIVVEEYVDKKTSFSDICQLQNKENRKEPFLKRIFARKLEKLYNTLTSEQIEQFLSLMPIHPWLLDGTLPDKFYGRIGVRSPEYRKGKRRCEPSPGCAWEHNISRKTNESNCRMFYDIFKGGFDRNNPNHRKVRRRAARVLLLRRVIRRINRAIQKPNKPRGNDPVKQKEYLKALADYPWKIHLKKTGPAWKQELLLRWNLDRSCE